MSMDDDKLTFLARWSRRKLEAKEELPAQPAQTEVPAPLPAVAQAAPLPELPPVDSLDGLKSEYKDFLHPQVDESLRRGALKKLFSDPHFNTMDMLDTYVDDYSIADPIPEAMLRQMIQSKTLALFEQDEKEDDRQPGAAGGAPAAEAAPMPVTQSQACSPATVKEATDDAGAFVPDNEKTNSVANRQHAKSQPD
jgi:hypothetical protein